MATSAGKVLSVNFGIARVRKRSAFRPLAAIAAIRQCLALGVGMPILTLKDGKHITTFVYHPGLLAPGARTLLASEEVPAGISVLLSFSPANRSKPHRTGAQPAGRVPTRGSSQ